MNTKTTKFLAVLAVVAVAFAAFAVIIPAEQGDATDYVDDIAYTTPSGLQITALDDTLVLYGTAAGTSIGSYANLGTHFASIMLTPNANVFTGDSAITKIVVTDSAFAFDYGADAPALGIAKVGDTYKYTPTTVTSVVVPLPVDGSNVVVEFYSGYTGNYVLEREITLDCSDVYTQVEVDKTNAAQSYPAKFDQPASYWKYTEVTVDNEIIGTLTMSNYYGNEIFDVSNVKAVDLKGNNYLTAKIADGTQDAKQSVALAKNSALYSTAALTITSSAGSLLSIDIEAGEYNKGAADQCLAGIYSAGALNMSGFQGKIAIDIDGEIEKADSASITSMGIRSVGDLTVGSDSNYVDLDVSVAETDGYAFGITSKADVKVYANGKVSAGNTALGQVDTALKNVEVYGDSMVLTGSESALKSYGNATVLGVKDLKLKISGLGVYNTGVNQFYGLHIKERGTTNTTEYSLEIKAGCIVQTDGFTVVKKDSLQIKTWTITNAGILIVDGDYVQNPEASDATGSVAGLSWRSSIAESAVTGVDKIYGAKPDLTSGYILLTEDCEVYGQFTILDASGKAVTAVYNIDGTTNTFVTLATALEGTTYSNIKTMYVNVEATAVALATATVAVPSTMELIMNFDSSSKIAASGTVKFTCGTQTFTLENTSNSDAGSLLAGDVEFSKDGLVVGAVSKLKLSNVKGDVALTGAITDTAGAQIEAEGSTVNVTFLYAKAQTFANAVTIKSNGATVDIPEGVEITLSGALVITTDEASSTSVLNIAGTVTPSVASAITLKKANANVSGVIADYGGLAVDLDGKSVLNVLDGGVVGFSKTGTAVQTMVGGDTSHGVKLLNVTGPLAIKANGETVDVSGTIAQYSGMTSKATFLVSNVTKELTIGKNVTADAATTANDLLVNGTLNVVGTLKGDEQSEWVDALVIGSNADAKMVVTGKVMGYFKVGSTTITLTQAKYSFKGYTVSYTEETEKATLSGALNLSKTFATGANPDFNVTTGTLKVSDLTMQAGGIISAANNAIIQGSIIGPESEKVTLDAKAGTGGLKVTAGSLTLTGAATAGSASGTTVSVDAGTVTIADVATSVTFIDTVVVNKDAELEATFVDANVTIASLTVKDGSEVSGTKYITATAATVEAGAELDGAIANATYAEGAYLTYEVLTGALDGYVMYLKVVKSGSNYYAVGGPVNYYTGSGTVSYKDASGTLVPLTSSSFKPYAALVSTLGATDTNLATASSSISKTVSDSVGVTADAFSIAIKDVAGTFKADAAVDPAEIAMTITISITGADNESYKSWDSSWTVNTVTGVAMKTFYVSDKTTTFGDLPVVIKTEYVFKDWELADQTGKVFDPTQSIYVYTNAFANTQISLVPAFKSVYDTTCTVTFDSQGGSAVPSQTVSYATAAVEPDDPYMEGYAFVGWFTDADCTALFNFKALITSDITLYAGWIEDKTEYADEVEIAVSKITGGVKVTVAGDEDLPVPAGKVTVRYAYWFQTETAKVLRWGTVTENMTAGPIVNSVNVDDISETPIFVEVSYLSTDGKVQQSAPRIVY